MENTDLAYRKALVERLRQDPDGYESNLEMGLYCAGRRDFLMQAEPFLRKALAHNRVEPRTERLLGALGEILMRRGAPAEAVSAFGKLNELYPAHVNHRFLLGDALAATGDAEAASGVYRSALAALDRNAEAVSRRLDRPSARILSPASTLHRHIGEMAHSLDLFLKARALGWIDPFEAILIAPEDDTVNMALADCLKPHVTVMSEPDAIEKAHAAFGDCPFFVNYIPLPDGRVVHRDLAYGAVQHAWSQEKHPPILTLPDDFRERGGKALGSLGLGENDWFACLHVRERGFYGESAQVAGTHNELRNATIGNYLPAIRAVTDRGGWVVRVGDASTTPLPAMDRVIDYAHSPARAPWLDVFLFAAGRFFMGTPSGPMNVARAFGVPVAAMDFFPAGAWHFQDHDLFIPKLHLAAADGRVLSIGEALRPPLCGAWNPLIYESQGIRIRDNAPEDIAAATIEMMDRLDGHDPRAPEDAPALAAYARQADPYGTGALLPLAVSFLRRHPEVAADD